MPELPEVETTRRGIEPHCRNKVISEIIIRESRLRWPVPESLAANLRGQTIEGVDRRAKYLLFGTGAGILLVHLGMSGSLRVIRGGQKPQRHDHIDIVLEGGIRLRYHDPRRFGCFLWLHHHEDHPLLSALGPEPLSSAFGGNLLYGKSRRRRGPVKNFIMDGKVVVGVGNIYANEALFLAGIRPDRAANRISLARYEALASTIKEVLTTAIDQGGTTLKDFVQSDGRPGYFSQQLHVYGRANLPCTHCGAPLQARKLGQRTSVYCMACQR
ncbi:MAG: bifunctional DNA-formamidopyrimidine glycosylase/DNA-(apurinic or apyrimidinic site) lyase [Halieaceae bacterium]|nr:bifunctional DNA-formamidopyrimidine glycosylase/DNA-(apurinic or apyrimidinic site) lyase [Halieaceae bacterium]